MHRFIVLLSKIKTCAYNMSARVSAPRTRSICVCMHALFESIYLENSTIYLHSHVLFYRNFYSYCFQNLCRDQIFRYINFYVRDNNNNGKKKLRSSAWNNSNPNAVSFVYLFVCFSHVCVCVYVFNWCLVDGAHTLFSECQIWLLDINLIVVDYYHIMNI